MRVDVRGQGPTTAQPGHGSDVGQADFPGRRVGDDDPRPAPPGASAPDLSRRPVSGLEARHVAPADLSRNAPPVASGHLSSAEREGRRAIILAGDGPPLTEAQLFAAHGLEP